MKLAGSACWARTLLSMVALFGLAACDLPQPQLHLAGLVHYATPTLPILPTASTTPINEIIQTPMVDPTAEIEASPTSLAAQVITLTPSTMDYCSDTPPVRGECILPSHFLFHLPIPPEYNDWVAPTYRYGSTQEGTRDPHHGVEFENPIGTPVVAAAPGTVLFAGNDGTQAISPSLNAYGNVVILQHQFPEVNQPIYTVYGHLSAVLVKTGQTVQLGDSLGRVGQTGAALGPHLHFEVRLGENSFDDTSNPELWLIPHIDPDGLQYGVLVGQLLPRDNADHPAATLNLNLIQNNVISKETKFIPVYPWDMIRNKGIWQEHFAIGSLLPGQYRLAVLYHGKLYIQIIQIYPGQVTWVTFNTNPN